MTTTTRNRKFARLCLERLEDRLAPANMPLANPTLSPIIAPQILNQLRSAPPIPIASSALQQPQFADLVTGVIDDVECNLQMGRFTQSVNNSIATITVNPVQRTVTEQADFAVPLGSFLTLQSPQKVDVTLTADYVLVVQVDQRTGVATIIDGNVSQATNNSALPATTMSVRATGTLPDNFVALGDMGGKLVVTAKDRGDTNFTGTFAINLGSFAGGRVSLNSTGGLQTSPPPAGTPGPQPVVTLDGRALLDFELFMLNLPQPGLPFSVNLSANLLAGWTFFQTKVAPTADEPFGNLTIELSKVAFDLGTLTNSIRGAVDSLRTVTGQPGIAQFVEVFGIEFPLVNRSLGDVLLPDALANSIEAVRVLNHLEVTPQSGRLELGTFYIQNAEDPARINVRPGLDAKPANAPELIAVLNAALNALGDDDDPTVGLQFPIFADPTGTLTRLFAGKQTSLVTFKTPAIDFDFRPPLAGALSDLGVGLRGGVHARFQVSVGIDTEGLYIDQRETHALLEGGLELRGSAGVSVKGGIYGDVRVRAAGKPDLNDPQKRRLDEASPIASSGRLYLEARVGVGLGPFSYTPFVLGYKELLNFGSDPDRIDASRPVIKVETKDHVLMLDANLIRFGDSVTVRPLVNRTLNNDDPVQYTGIRVDYADRTVVYVEARDGQVVNRYDTVALTGGLGATVRVHDPFGALREMGVPDPQGVQRRVILAGGAGNDTLEYHDNGSRPKVLLLGGGGDDQMLGGDLMFADNVPAEWQAAAADYLPLAVGTPADLAARATLAARLAAGQGPVGTALLIGNRGGTLVGSRGRTIFEAAAAVPLEMFGGPGANEFRVQPTFNAGRASYFIRGGIVGSVNDLIVIQGRDAKHPEGKPLVINVYAAAVADLTDPSRRALAVSDADGEFVVAHGLGGVVVLPDSEVLPAEVGFGDLGETTVTRTFVDAGRGRARTVPLVLKFTGSTGDDAFRLTPKYPTSADSSYAELVAYYDRYRRGVPADLELSYTSARSGGTTGTLLRGLRTIDRVKLDGAAGDDRYELRLGANVSASTEISDTGQSGANTLEVEGFAVFEYFRGYLRLDTLAVTDDTLAFSFHTPPRARYLGRRTATGQFFAYERESVPPIPYTANVKFSPNVRQVSVSTEGAFREVVVNRPRAPQALALEIGTAPEFWVSEAGFNDTLYHDPDNGSFFFPPEGRLDQTNRFEILANGGILDLFSSVPYPLTVRANAGVANLTFQPSIEAIDIRGNSGTLNLNLRRSGHQTLFYGAFPTTVNLGNAGNLSGIGGVIHLGGVNTAVILNIDDSTNSVARQWSIGSTQLRSEGLLLDYAADAPDGNAPLSFRNFSLHTGTHSVVEFVGQPNLSQLSYLTPPPRVEVEGGSGSLLRASDSDHIWQLLSTDRGELDGVIHWRNFAQLLGGARTDRFRFAPGAGVTGSIDGGEGLDVLDYSVFDSAYFANLDQGVATAIAGAALNIEASSPDPLSTTDGTILYREGDAARFAPAVTGRFAPFQYTALELPVWLSLDTATGEIIGTVPDGAADGSPYSVQVRVRDSVGNERTWSARVFVSAVGSLTVVGGDGQSALVSTVYSRPLSVKLTDVAGRPLENVRVAFQIPTVRTAGVPGATFPGGDPSRPGGSTIAIALTGPDGVAISPPLTANEFPGSFTVTAMVLDLDANQVTFGLTNLAAVSDDVTPPETQITSGPAARTRLNLATFEFAGSDDVAVAGFEYKLDEADWQPTESPLVLVGLADGEHTLQVRALDTAGNADTMPAMFTWVIDSAPPVLTPPADVEVEANGPEGTAIDFRAATAEDPHGPVTIDYSHAPGSVFPLGTTTVSVTATDALGNATTGTFMVTVVAPAPVVTIITSPPPLTASRSAVVEFTATDRVTPTGDLILEVRLDGGNWQVVASTTQALSDLIEGPHTFAVRATNAAGKVSEVATVTWTIDLTPPSLIAPDIVAEATSPTGAAVDFVVDSADTNGIFEINFAIASGATLPIGQTSVAVTASDTVGNSTTLTFTVTLRDTTPPVVLIINKPDAFTQQPNAAFAFAATDAVTAADDLLFEFTLDGDDWQVGTAALEFTGLSEGPHTVSVRATDIAGNVSDAVTYTWIIDATSPELEVPSAQVVEATGPDGAAVPFNPTATDANLSRIATSRPVRQKFPVGTNIVTTIAIDQTGNFTKQFSSVVVTDTAAPVVSITGGPPTVTTQTSADFAFSATDVVTPVAGLHFETNLDGQGWQPASTTLHLDGLAIGTHTLAVRAIDGAGNVSNPAATVWTILASKPKEPTVDDLAATDGERFVLALYRALLERDASVGEYRAGHIAAWADAEKKLGRVGMITLFTQSEERRQLKVITEFKKYLGRTPDAESLASAAKHLEKGKIEDVIAGILASEEYARRVGGGRTEILTQIYRDSFGREIDKAGLESALKELDEGLGLNQLLQQRLASEEYRSKQILGIYAKYLAHTPGANEVNGWVDQRVVSNDDAVLAKMLGDPGEEFAHKADRK